MAYHCLYCCLLLLYYEYGGMSYIVKFDGIMHCHISILWQVVCSQCQHVSVTFEPFMYLSVPLPHALERQIC